MANTKQEVSRLCFSGRWFGSLLFAVMSLSGRSDFFMNFFRTNVVLAIQSQRKISERGHDCVSYCCRHCCYCVRTFCCTLPFAHQPSFCLLLYLINQGVILLMIKRANRAGNSIQIDTDWSGYFGVYFFYKNIPGV